MSTLKFLTHNPVFRADWLDSKSTEDLINKYGASLTTLYRASKEMGLPPRSRGPKPRQGPRPVTPRDRKIVDLRTRGQSYRVIAPAVGVSYEMVRQILHEIGRSDLCQHKLTKGS